MNRVLKGLKSWATPIFWITVGAVIGACLVMPLLPDSWRLPDAMANILGSSLGAIAGVVGVIVLWKMQEADSRAKVEALIENSCAHLISALVELYGVTSPEVRRDREKVTLIADRTVKAIGKFRERAKRYESDFGRLSSRLQAAHLDLEAELGEIEGGIGEAMSLWRYAAADAYAHSESELRQHIWRCTVPLLACAKSEMAFWPVEYIDRLNSGHGIPKALRESDD